MCELLAISSRYPTRVDFSLERLARHGGREGPHRDGWGVAYVEGRDALVLREPHSASDSALVRFMEQNGPPSDLVISHIRLATQGEVALMNTQPLQRELGGRVHVFAHNGRLQGIEDHCDLASKRFLPVGDTDSEVAFCCLLERLAGLWATAGNEPPPLEVRLQAIADFAAWLRPFGPANFLYADGDALFVHAHRRTQKDGEIRPPGLHLLGRSCDVDASGVEQAGVAPGSEAQKVSLVASVPLGDESWEPLAEGEVLALIRGEVVTRLG